MARLLLDDLEAILEREHDSGIHLTSNCTIFKVPEQLRRVDHFAYIPNNISIGPYHYGDARFETMQKFKLEHFQNFLKRTNNRSYEILLTTVQEREDKIRECYSEVIPMESSKFVKLITFDACFILDFLLSVFEGGPIIQATKAYLMIDLIKLENQIPYFILKIIFDEAMAEISGMAHKFEDIVQTSLVNLVLKHICPEQNSTTNNWASKRIGTSVESTPYHLCDLVRKFYMKRSQTQRYGLTRNRSYSVRELHSAGLKFLVNHNASMIEMVGHNVGGTTLKIPSFSISGWSETIIRNVIALELCFYPSCKFVTEYIFLLHNLINTEDDVDFFVEKGIMYNSINRRKVIEMISKLCDQVDVTQTSHCYGNIHSLLEDFYDHKYRKHKAAFVQQYWNTPLKKLSLLVLFFTLVSTICSSITTIKGWL